LGGGIFFNSLMYGGKFPKNNLGISNREFYIKTFRKLFQDYSAQKNPFLQFLFFGKLKNVLPFVAKKENFEKIKKNLLEIEFEFLEGDFRTEIQKFKNIDFVSMSDIVSYLSDEGSFDVLENIKNSLKKNAIVISRAYLNVPKINSKSFLDMSRKFKNEIEKEKTQMYDIKIFQKK
jgi:S-adenosylmethionine:diacylglycerol 3-amino-3-carboxypropyl transferase